MPNNISSNSQLINGSLRALQAILSMIALSTLVAGFAVTSVRVDGDTFTTMGATPTTNFMMLLSYTSMLYAVWHVAAIELTSCVPKMSACVEMAIDSVFVLLYFIGSIVFATLPYVRHCGEFLFGAIRCYNLMASVVFCFVTMLTFLSSLVWVYFQNKRGMGDSQPMNLAKMENRTPTSCAYSAE